MCPLIPFDPSEKLGNKGLMLHFILRVGVLFFALHLGIQARALPVHNTSISQGNIAGLIQIDPGSSDRLVCVENELYRIEAANIETRSDLLKLGNGDLLIGYGVVDRYLKEVTLFSVDFVGLKRILGYWVARSDIVNFINFQTMTLIRRQFFDLLPILPNLPAREHQNPFVRSSDFDSKSHHVVNYDYAMAPSQETPDSWILLMSNAKGDRIATFALNSSKALLKLYAPDSGALLRELYLVKLH